MMKNKNLYTIIVIVVLIVVAGIIYWYAQQGGQTPSYSQNTSANKSAKVSTTQPSGALTYAEALKTYASRRIQFSISSSNYCSVSPNSPVFKKGTNIMLDNRSAKQIKVALDGQPYYIKAYGFDIVNLTTSAKLPHTVRVDCETGVNNASIILD